MPKYTDEIKAKAVQMVKEGKALAEIQRQLGPNPKAIGRYCAKAGVSIPKAPKAPKTDKPKAPVQPVKKN
jgi:transposase-like protein